ncbi:hypothetical protein [Microvirga alba]|uniref:Uncharacterized protein n=1 Tax=Microvirga alba TaxID=2791025 RepID=A0A931BIF1_9HYPH|nr:hypothetical protein [Microvirga alba]MBF9231766.1 hypothetical protein [Microvirga alba]
MTKITAAKLFVPAVILATLSGSPVLAQESPNSKAMVLTVRPSGYEASGTDAQARQQRLLQRMEQSDYMVRSICSQCGDNWKHQTYAPFNPLASLSARNKIAEEMTP